MIFDRVELAPGSRKVTQVFARERVPAQRDAAPSRPSHDPTHLVRGS